MTEKEFLKSYDITKYQRPSVTTDIVVFSIIGEDEESYRKDPRAKLCVLLVKRAEHPYKGMWALPGGFLRPDETVEECALREIKEETNVLPVSIMQIGVFSRKNRDPRGWIISNAFTSVLGEESARAIGGDDADEAVWFEVDFDGHFLTLIGNDIKIDAELEETDRRFGKSEYSIIKCEGLAFDHAKIIATAIGILRYQAKDIEIAFDFLPPKFTLNGLQKVQETILNISLLQPNFRRKVADLVEETDEYFEGAGHRPAKLYKRKK